MNYGDKFQLVPMTVMKNPIQVEFTLTKWNLLLQLSLFSDFFVFRPGGRSMVSAVRCSAGSTVIFGVTAKLFFDFEKQLSCNRMRFPNWIRTGFGEVREVVFEHAPILRRLHRFVHYVLKTGHYGQFHTVIFSIIVTNCQVRKKPEIR